MDSHYAECTFEPGILSNVPFRSGYLISSLLSVDCCSYTLHLAKAFSRILHLFYSEYLA